MTQHTPGPWGLSEYGQIINPAATSTLSRQISVTGGVSTPSPDTAESNANRDLIVQAPAMLAALKQALEFVGLHTNNGAPNHVDVITDPEQVRDLIEAVITAAEGGAAKHVHSFSIWHDRQDRPARGYSRCACGVEPGDDWAEGAGDTQS